MRAEIIMQAIAVQESSQAGEARRSAAGLAKTVGLPEAAAGRLAIVVTEAANNLARHARHGELLLRASAMGVEVWAVDRGPGIGDIQAALRDGHSTAGTPGTGLGAMQRMSDWFDIYSQQPGGTVIASRIDATPLARVGPLDVGVVSAPHPHEKLCGDAFSMRQEPGRAIFCMADGLGHGPDAFTAAREAVRAFEQAAELDPVHVLQEIHAELRKTRGAAAAVAEVDFAASRVRYSGVGNISAAVFGTGPPRRMVSHNGILGHDSPRIREFTYAWEPDALLIMYSDGLGTNWDLSKYPGLAHHHPALIAGVLYRDFKRGRDDVTVAVAHQRA